MAEQQTAGFKAELNSEFFEAYLSAVDALADEAVVRIEEDGLQSAAVDPANVAMVEAQLSGQAFRLFDRSDSDFGVSTYKLHPLLEETDEDVASLDYDVDTRKLELRLGPYLYTHSTVSPDTVRDEPTIPDLDDLAFTGRVKIERLREAVDWFNTFAEHVKLGFDAANDELFMEAIEDRGNGSGTDDGVFQLERSELEGVRKPGEASSQFYLDYFSDIVAAVPDETVVQLRLGREMPFRLSYEIEGDDGESAGQVTFMQAPRIQSD